MGRIYTTAFTVVVVIAVAGAAQACEPGSSLAAKGGFAPSFAAAPKMAGGGYMGYGAFEGQKQLLAQQAAAYQAQRQQIRLAKAMQLREKNLTDRAERRALAVQKLEDYRRRKSNDNPTFPDAPQFANAANGVRR